MRLQIHFTFILAFFLTEILVTSYNKVQIYVYVCVYSMILQTDRICVTKP